ncbi:hypothetical protein UFOVP45_117 [uncultured Caudovirales phage]|uniref:Uncharacterized protein n=1 Tax=uncultured Caudovirales phage TaxID=2100421 RepID=A0A6J5KS23_9CAUD|nr:hypothetical protein UFOVP45_117 [uncultured Caudovirales phage]
MLTKDILAQPLSTEWAVVARTAYVSQSTKKHGNVQRRSTSKVKRVNDLFYAETSQYNDTASSPYFHTVANERVKRFLVTDGQIYWIVPASDFLGKYSDFEAGWIEQEAKDKIVEDNRERLSEIQNSAKAIANETVENLKVSIKQSIKSVLGFSGTLGSIVDVYATGDWKPEMPLGSEVYETSIVGKVSLDYSQFMRLMEKLTELEEA